MNTLFVKLDGEWTKLRNYPSYAAAVVAGQESCRPFYIDTGDRAPTREEQLLLEPEPESKRSVRQQILDTL